MSSGEYTPARVQAVAQQIIEQVERVIIGKRHVIEQLVTSILCEGHVLLEDVPGIGKTMLARSVAASVGGSFNRVQFTPDLLPTDITGSMVFDPRTAEFSYREGPVVTNVLLADEINRAGPRTQSALLEAMEERHVSVERERIALPRPFFALATQNPVELEGTFPLPEAQLDRFLIRLSIGYPSAEEERDMLQRFREETPLSTIEPVTTPDEMVALTAAIRRVHMHEDIDDYLITLIRRTREHDLIEVGASPRASLALARAAQAHAALHGRDYVLPDDIQGLAVPVLAHRLILTPHAELTGRIAADVLAALVQETPAPVEITTAV